MSSQFRTPAPSPTQFNAPPPIQFNSPAPTQYRAPPTSLPIQFYTPPALTPISPIILPPSITKTPPSIQNKTPTQSPTQSRSTTPSQFKTPTRTPSQYKTPTRTPSQPQSRSQSPVNISRSYKCIDNTFNSGIWKSNERDSENQTTILNIASTNNLLDSNLPQVNNCLGSQFDSLVSNRLNSYDNAYTDNVIISTSTDRSNMIKIECSGSSGTKFIPAYKQTMTTNPRNRLQSGSQTVTSVCPIGGWCLIKNNNFNIGGSNPGPIKVNSTVDNKGKPSLNYSIDTRIPYMISDMNGNKVPLSNLCIAKY